MRSKGVSWRAFNAMGTRFECVLSSLAPGVPVSTGAAIAEEIEHLVAGEHRRLSLFDQGSVVADINRCAARVPVSVDPELFALLDRCLGYARDTARAFDIAAGALMRAHGFRDDVADDPGHGSDHGSGAGPRRPAPPGADAVRLERVGNAGMVRLSHPGVEIDFGAVAKGYALDLVREELEHLGVTGALVHGGTSSVLAIGGTPSGEPWRVKLMDDDPASPTVELRHRALACSAPSGRTATARADEGVPRNGRPNAPRDGRPDSDGVGLEHGHIMDPRTGRPASGVEGACVIGPSAEVCEAWSTALVVDPGLITSLPAGYDARLRRDGRWSGTRTPPAVPGARAAPVTQNHSKNHSQNQAPGTTQTRSPLSTEATRHAATV